MYKKSSRFHQSLRQRGVKLQSGLHLSGKANQPRDRKRRKFGAKKLDNAAAERRITEWMHYLEWCEANEKSPSGVPKDILQIWENRGVTKD